MLSNLSDEGHATWQCPHCGVVNSEHVSHAGMEWTPREHINAVLARGLSEAEAQAAMGPMHGDMIALPPCGCGTRTFVKAGFSEKDLAAPNMLDADGHPTESHAAAHRHMALAGHMARVGKSRPTG